MPDRLPLSQWISGLSRFVWREAAADLGGPFRKFQLPQSAPRIRHFPDWVFPGDPAKAEPWLKGHIFLAGKGLRLTNKNPWVQALPSRDFADRLHSFDWLGDVISAKNGDAIAREICRGWMAAYGRWNKFAWAPDRLAQRLLYWLIHAKTLCKNTADADIADSIWRQLQYLLKIYKRTSPGLPRLYAACALSLAGHMFDDANRLRDQGLDWLEDEIDIQILADGGHICRSPDYTAIILAVFLSLSGLIKATRSEGSRDLDRALDRLAPMIKFFKVRPGHLAHFHSTGTLQPPQIKALGRAAPSRSRSFAYAPQTQFNRIDNNGTVLIMDTGGPPPPDFSHHAHASTLSFELFAPSAPIFVNCGYHEDMHPQWRDAARRHVAHNGLSLDGRDCSGIVTSGFAKRVFGPRLSGPDYTVKAKQWEETEGTWLDAQHDAWRKSHKLLHRRRIYVDANGSDIRGEDTLFLPMDMSPPRNAKLYDYEIRFHIHPDIKVSLAQDLRSALLILPNKEGWRFRTDRTRMFLEKSIYLADGVRPRPSEQLVLQGQALNSDSGRAETNQVLWALKRLGQTGRA